MGVASPSREPVIFNMDDEVGAKMPLQRPTSLEDWEQGLEMLSTAGHTRDRAASLRAHWLFTGKAGNSPAKARR
ncbi:unnamed protein product [Effrenium voratum]|nr:unnamed protein product [Effrenium voratum]